MSSDEEDNEISSSCNKVAFDIASAILFGNIDNNGELADDIFDDECKKHLSSLQPHLSSLLSYEVLIENSSEDHSQDCSNYGLEGSLDTSFDDKDTDVNTKSENAIDYFDINEFIDEEGQESLLKDLNDLRKESNENKEDNDYDNEHSTTEKTNRNENDIELQKDKDGFVIPQPICRGETTQAIITKSQKLVEEESNKENNESSKKRLDTPLAAMLPSKYADLDVTELFPEFRHNQVLRFSRLFGPGKSSSLPQIWKHVKNKRKNRHIFENKLFIIHSKFPSVQEKEWRFEICSPEDILPEMIELDDEIKLLQNDFVDAEYNKKSSTEDEENSAVAEWRYGPARIWYDRLKVPENGEGFDYGFKLKNNDDNEEEQLKTDISSKQQNDSDDAFHLVTQYQWENEVIWNADEIRQKILAKLNDKHLASGWLPSGHNRTATAFTQQMRASTAPKSTLPLPTFKKSDKKNIDNNNLNNNIKNNNNEEQQNGNTWFSIFPIENEELVYGLWENDIIWDVEAMEKIPSPKVLVLDRNDENIILEVPTDEDPNESKTNQPTKEKKEGIRKSRLLLGKAGVIAEPEILSPPSPPSNEKDPFNISNDEYYAQKTTTDASLKSNVGNNLIQHSIPALELRQPFFPTFLNYQRLLAFHRPALKKYTYGAIADTLPHGVNPLAKHIKRKAKLREQERIASGGGEMFFMRTPEDLTGKDGDLILTEYSEEHPPLLMQVGMAAKIKNYYKRKLGKDPGAPNYKYGETVYCHTSPFLGNLQHGQSLQAFENNLFRVPIYEHFLPETDFLVIRTRDNYYIREVETIYTVGQELPLYEVPGPNSKKANNFMRDFLQVFIFRLFWKSADNPRRIKMDDIKKAFPFHSESSIRKRLKQCADFKRTGMDSNWWVLKSDFRLPSEDEIRAMVSPEACCAYYSMLAAEQRLKDAGYGEKSMFAPDDAEDEDLQVKMDDEVKAAPWNTTRAFISAMKGKCLLQLTGVADPTGCGEGFSYVRIPNKPQQSKEEAQKEPMPKKTVTGTDADLRRLPLNAAKQLLRKFGVPDEEIKKLSRWEVIDVVRTLSTKQVKQQSGEGGEDDAMSKFARGNRFSIAEHQERYKEECQRIFDLQNRVLASTEDLSTDEDESEEEEDSEIEELGKNIESMLANKKTINQISIDKEEEERRELKKLILGEQSNQGNDSMSNKKRKDFQKDDDNDDSINMNSSNGRILKIYRTYTNAEGKEYVRIETVRKPAVIDTYVRIRNTKDDNFIKQFASALDEQQKEEKRKEKRRLQEQQRRLKRNQEKEKLANSLRTQFGMNIPTTLTSNSSPFIFNQNNVQLNLNEPNKESKLKKIRKEKETNLKLKCGACGSVGHMRTNRACPLYKCDSNSFLNESGENVDGNSSILNEDNLVKVDETKLILSKSVIKHLDEQQQQLQQQQLQQQLLQQQQQQQKNKAIKLKIPKEVLTMKRKRRIATNDNCDYLQKPDYKSANRRRTDPLVILSDIFEDILNEMRSMPDTEPFHAPVNVKTVPDYYKIIEKPMDLQTIRQNIRNKRYKNREEFLNDVSLIVKNSEIYNGANHIISSIAKKMMELCFLKIQQKEEEIIKLEKVINPLLDEDQVAFSYILKTIVAQKLKTIPETWPFHKPVNKKTVKNYYDIIKNPMDLETLESNAQNHKYKSREEFLEDVELIYENSVKFNGLESQFTKKAAQIVEVARTEIEQYQIQLIELERAIVNPHNLGLEDIDDESNMADYEDDEPPIKQRHIDIDDYNIEMNEEKSFSSAHYSRDLETDIVAHDLQITPPNSGEESDVDESLSHENSSWQNHPMLNQQNSEQKQYHRNMIELNEEDNFDENYDPSEFLLKSSFAQQSSLFQQQQQMAIAESNNEITEQVDVSRDLDISESDEEQNEEDNELWF